MICIGGSGLGTLSKHISANQFTKVNGKKIKKKKVPEQGVFKDYWKLLCSQSGSCISLIDLCAENLSNLASLKNIPLSMLFLHQKCLPMTKNMNHPHPHPVPLP